MAATAGLRAEAGRIPGERIATTTTTADSSTFTTSSEIIVQSVTAALVSGRTYRVRAWQRWQSTVANDRINCRLREDNVSGTTLQQAVHDVPSTGSLIGPTQILEVEFTASSTGDKTFVASAVRLAGSGSCNLDAGAAAPCYLYVDYISG